MRAMFSFCIFVFRTLLQLITQNSFDTWMDMSECIPDQKGLQGGIF